jgi:hypothetical protein
MRSAQQAPQVHCRRPKQSPSGLPVLLQTSPAPIAVCSGRWPSPSITPLLLAARCPSSSPATLFVLLQNVSCSVCIVTRSRLTPSSRAHHALQAVNRSVSRRWRSASVAEFERMLHTFCLFACVASRLVHILIQARGVAVLV